MFMGSWQFYIKRFYKQKLTRPRESDLCFSVWNSQHAFPGQGQPRALCRPKEENYLRKMNGQCLWADDWCVVQGLRSRCQANLMNVRKEVQPSPKHSFLAWVYGPSGYWAVWRQCKRLFLGWWLRNDPWLIKANSEVSQNCSVCYWQIWKGESEEAGGVFMQYTPHQ